MWKAACWCWGVCNGYAQRQAAIGSCCSKRGGGARVDARIGRHGVFQATGPIDRDAMRRRLRTADCGRADGLQETQGNVEPVFGIIKSAMGFRHFLLRGMRKVALEWSLVTLAYNFRRLARLISAAKTRDDGDWGLQTA